jgi:hypothetical protein
MTDRKQAVRLLNNGEVVAEMSIEVEWNLLEFCDVDPHTRLVGVLVDDGELELSQVDVLEQLVWDRGYRSHLTTMDQSIVVIDEAPRADREVQVMSEVYQLISSLPEADRVRAVEWVSARVRSDVSGAVQLKDGVH